MAVIETIKRTEDDIHITLDITEQESRILGSSKDVLVLPKKFQEKLTTGKLGNSNRIMMPKKIQRKYDINMMGKVPAQVFEIKNKKFLLIEIDKKTFGVPRFKV